MVILLVFPAIMALLNAFLITSFFIPFTTVLPAIVTLLLVNGVYQEHPIPHPKLFTSEKTITSFLSRRVLFLRFLERSYIASVILK